MVEMTLQEIDLFAKRCSARALLNATKIDLSNRTPKSFSENIRENYSRSGSARAHSLSDDPDLADLEPFEGSKGWGAALAYDLRESSKLAEELSPKAMYVLMHTYMSTMLEVLHQGGGQSAGLRGDGGISIIGRVELDQVGRTVTEEEGEEAVYLALDCGEAIRRAVELVLTPHLRGLLKLKRDLLVGVGVDVGDFVITDIGVGSARELTAYGQCVNNAAKRAFGNNTSVFTNKAKGLFPTKPGGKWGFTPYPGVKDAHVPTYPPNRKPLRS